MAKRALFINPWIEDFSAYDCWMMPLGLLALAAIVREQGVAVDVVDCLSPALARRFSCLSHPNPVRYGDGSGKFLKSGIPRPEALRNVPRKFRRYGIGPEELRRLLDSRPRPDLILVTTLLTYWYTGTFALIRLIKDIYPGVPVVLGGTYATLCPEHALFSGADVCCSGAGEAHISLILNDLLGMRVSYRPDLEHLDSLPRPAFDLLDAPEQIPLQTSRGCPFSCPYCASRRLQPHYRRRSPESVIDEIRHWHAQLGVRHYSLYDDAFLFQSETLAVPLLEQLAARRLPLEFHCPNGLHLREMTPRIARLLKAAGFSTLRFGYETADAARQRALGGKATNDHFDAALAYLADAGYDAQRVGIYLLCGLPDQTADEIEASIRHVLAHGARPMLTEYSPLPGTDLWPQACAVSPHPIASEPLWTNNVLMPCRHESLTPQRFHALKAMTRPSFRS